MIEFCTRENGVGIGHVTFECSNFVFFFSLLKGEQYSAKSLIVHKKHLILLGHMQKISHFWAKIKKDPKCQLGHFCPEPFNYRY